MRRRSPTASLRASSRPRRSRRSRRSVRPSSRPGAAGPDRARRNSPGGSSPPGLCRVQRWRLAVPAAAAADHEPDALGALAVGLPGLLVTGEVVERPLAVHDLHAAVLPRGRGQQRGVEALGGLWRALGDNRGPRLRALLVAGALTARVVGEAVERAALGVGEDRPVLRVGDLEAAGGTLRRLLRRWRGGVGRLWGRLLLLGGLLGGATRAAATGGQHECRQHAEAGHARATRFTHRTLLAVETEVLPEGTPRGTPWFPQTGRSRAAHPSAPAGAPIQRPSGARRSSRRSSCRGDCSPLARATTCPRPSTSTKNGYPERPKADAALPAGSSASTGVGQPAWRSQPEGG